MVLARLVEVLRISESRTADSVGQLHIIADERDQKLVATKAEQLRMETVVRLMDAMEVAASNRLLITVIDCRQSLDRLQRRRQSNPQGGLPLKNLTDLVDLPDLVGSEAAYEGSS